MPNDNAKAIALDPIAHVEYLRAILIVSGFDEEAATRIASRAHAVGSDEDCVGEQEEALVKERDHLQWKERRYREQVAMIDRILAQFYGPKCDHSDSSFTTALECDTCGEIVRRD